MLLNKIFYFLLSLLVVVRSDNEYPRVKTPLGYIIGYYKISQSGKKYEAYEGVPYALPPSGNLRFKDPQPIASWADDLDATKFSPECAQFVHTRLGQGEQIKGAEDCLYLNIYAPLRNSNSPLFSVIIYIHGGCFQFGSGRYGAKYLVDSNVVVISIQYRLGPLGFLSTEDDVVQGNMGLKDQSMALRWISKNIKSFGGNPKKLMLVGLSAGGSSVHYHYLSPLSKGLFQSGFSISGTALDCWAQTENSLEKAKKLGAIVGCPTTNNKVMVDCLRTRPFRQLLEAVKKFMPWLYNPYTPFGPVVEKGGNQPFISDSPWNIISSGKAQDLPWITSVVSEEGLYPVADFGLSKKHMQELNDNWLSIAPHLLDYNYTIPKPEQNKVSTKIREHYIGSAPVNVQSLMSLTHMVGDRLFVVDAEKAARIQAKNTKSPVWFYYYSYRANQSLSDVYTPNQENIGVSHGDDSLLVMENNVVNPSGSEKDLLMMKDLRNIWVSFATNGKPSADFGWTPVNPSKSDFSYLHIKGPNDFRMEKNSNFGQKRLWSKLGFKENDLECDNNNI